LSGDINLCGCNPPPTFHAERNMAMSFTSDEAKALMEGLGATTAKTAGSNIYDQHFRLTDQNIGEPLRNAPYRIVTEDGKGYEGRTDSQGHKLRVSSVSDIGATFHVIADEMPINPDWDRYL
jgi:uncharacterized protein (DUF2345 family)